jgi:hypothetical protein
VQRTKVFGTELSALLKRSPSSIPPFVDKAISYLEAKGTYLLANSIQVNEWCVLPLACRVVPCACRVVSCHVRSGLGEEGLFRISGNKATMDDLQLKIDCGMDYNFEVSLARASAWRTGRES